MKKKLVKILCVIYLCFFAFETLVIADNLEGNCTTIEDILIDLQNIFDFIKIIIPLIIIGLSSIDFIKAISQKDDKDIKKAFVRLMKRLIYAVIFFFLPVILNVFVDFIIEDISVCIK